MATFIANVGANRSTAPRIRSPRGADGRFDLVPILDEGVPGALNPTYEELPSTIRSGRSLAEFVHPALRQRRAHADPEFLTLTYGDIWNGRSSNLFRAASGDVLLFLARLWDYSDGHWGTDAFYLVAKFVIAYIVDIAADETPSALERRVGPDVMRAIARNANFQRVAAGERVRSIVVVADSTRSFRFERALRVDQHLVGQIYGGVHHEDSDCYMRDGVPLLSKNGRPRRFRSFGSATRAIQPWPDADEGLLARVAECAAPDPSPSAL